MRPWFRNHPRADLITRLLIGLVCGLVALGGYTQDRELSKTGVPTTALVLGIEGGKDVSYRVRFSLPNGEVVEASTAFARDGAREGDHIKIEYDPADPSVVGQIGARSGVAIEYVGWGLVGLGATVSAAWPWRRLPRRPDAVK